MLTYLSLNVHKWKRRPFLFLIVLLLPLISFFTLYPLFKTSVSDTAVPIAIVVEDDSEWAGLVQERVGVDKRIRIRDMSSEEAKEAVQKGNVEAAFILQEGFMENLKSGNISDSVEWLRTEGSDLDVFVKEQIGAEMMRLALNAKVANTLQNWESSVEWEEAFLHSDKHWQPDPLFQMEFVAKSPEQREVLENQLESWKLVVMAIFFLYAWIWFISLLNEVSRDEKAGRIARVLLLRSTVRRYYVMHFLIFGGAASAAYFLALNGMLYITNTGQELVVGWNVWSVIVLFTTLLLSYIVFLLWIRSAASLMAIILFALISFTLYVLPFQASGMWTTLLPHNWLIELNPWEAGGM